MVIVKASGSFVFPLLIYKACHDENGVEWGQPQWLSSSHCRNQIIYSIISQIS